MSIAGVRRRGTAFDRRRRRDRERPGLAFAAVGRPCHRDPRLAAADDDVGDADRRAVVEPGAEVGVQADAEPDAGDQRVGVRIDRGRADVGVPGVVGRKRERAVQRGAGAKGSGGEVAVAGFPVDRLRRSGRSATTARRCPVLSVARPPPMPPQAASQPAPRAASAARRSTLIKPVSCAVDGAGRIVGASAAMGP